MMRKTATDRAAQQGCAVNVESTAPFEVACTDCMLYGVLDVIKEIERVGRRRGSDVLKRRQPVRKGQSLYRAGKPARALYAVKSGSFKSFEQRRDGGEQVLGFAFPGEVLGLDALSESRYRASACALEDSSVCELRLGDLSSLGKRLPDFQQQLIGLLGQQVLALQERSALAVRQTVEERLAGFLLGLSRRFARCGLSPLELNLPMSRQDIASYLGTTMESVSRVVKRFQRRGVLVASGKRIRLSDLASLEVLAQSPVGALA